MLIGADLFWQIVGNEQRCLGANLPYLRSSQLGWLISGPIFSNGEPRSIKCNFSRIDTSDNLNEKISRFWELEELPKRPLLSSSEKEYEYVELGHCSPVEGRPSHARRHYLCHHAVLRTQSESTKLRVVFDGSAPTSTGVSINDIQHTGPKVQDSIFAILLRFRTHKYVLAGDINKFFRQVLVYEDDRQLQLILWREDEKKPLKTIRLNTVTYGFASASYLTTKCLWTLGEECRDETIKQIIQKDFYCDDMLTGSDTKADLLHILNAVTTHLKSGCFNLRKFKSNAPDIFPISTVDLQGKLSLSDASSALGLGWSPQSDELYFTIEAPTSGSLEKFTKRTILSSTFSIYDPLGLLSPCTVQPKLLMQQLWRRGLDWDVPVPDDLQKEWKKITASLSSLANITIPRRALSGDPVEIQLHSFCEASMHAYGACIYLRCKDKEGIISVNLLCAKSRVAPTKPPLTIPKLELLGALLAANLTKNVLESLRCSISSCTHWCDSNVVLAWLHSSPSKLKSFVANKVVEICEHTVLSAWRHVPGAANPADVISRGASADQLAAHELWWCGPPYLAADDSQWPQAPSETKKQDDDLPEIIVLPSTSSDCDDLSIPMNTSA
ncbi:uncharacterized protein LOC121726109 [Aricia agestis]|uniref:uncharacterized protein LOC121726109 n=1 Tax=Aricia agestis TaxID=91739 RepID=UPI001C2060C1|nr:uncharacterized protein LOC121726109 [Aricia agestis]